MLSVCLIEHHAVWRSVGIAPLIVFLSLHVDDRLASCPTALLLEKEALVSVEYGARWNPEKIATFQKRKKYLPPIRN